MSAVETETITVVPTLSLNSIEPSKWTPPLPQPINGFKSRRSSVVEASSVTAGLGKVTNPISNKIPNDFEVLGNSSPPIIVRPKTTNVRMGRQRSQDMTEPDDKPVRPRTTNVRSVRKPSQVSDERPEWSSDTLQYTPRLKPRSRHPSNESITRPPMITTFPSSARSRSRHVSGDSLYNGGGFDFAPSDHSFKAEVISNQNLPTSIPRYASNDSLNRVSFVSQEPPPWASRKPANVESSPTPVPAPAPAPAVVPADLETSRPKSSFRREKSFVESNPDPTKFISSKPKRGNQDPDIEPLRPVSPLQVQSSTSVYRHPRIVKSDSKPDYNASYYDLTHVDTSHSPASILPSKSPSPPHSILVKSSRRSSPRPFEKENQYSPGVSSLETPTAQVVVPERQHQNELAKITSPSSPSPAINYQDKMRNVDINQTYFQDRSGSRLSGNLRSYERPMSKTSFSRHFANDRRQSIASSYSIPSSVRGLRPTNSLSLLPLVRSCADAGAIQPMNLSNDDRSGSEWDLSTSKREYKYWNDGFNKARSNPFRHVPTLKIGVEGKRFFEPEKQDSYVRFPDNVVRDARPPLEPPRNATHLLGPFPNDPIYGITPPEKVAESRMQSANKPPRPSVNDGFFGPEPPYTPQTNSSRAPSARTSRIYEPEEYQAKHEFSKNSVSKDLRFANGTTTQSTYRDHHVASNRDQLMAAKPLRPWSSSIRTGVEGDFSRQVSSREHFPERPYAREMPTVRRPSLSVPGMGHIFTNETTYQSNVDNVIQFATFNPSRRFDSKFKIPNQIDWL